MSENPPIGKNSEKEEILAELEQSEKDRQAILEKMNQVAQEIAKRKGQLAAAPSASEPQAQTPEPSPTPAQPNAEKPSGISSPRINLIKNIDLKKEKARLEQEAEDKKQAEKEARRAEKARKKAEKGEGKFVKAFKSGLGALVDLPEGLLNDEIENYESNKTKRRGNASTAPKINLVNKKIDRGLNILQSPDFVPKEFENLNEAQKLKVAQDMNKRVVDIVKADAETQYSEATKSKWKAIWGAVNKAKTIKNLEKEIFQKMSATPEGQELLRQNLETLIENTKGKNIKISPEGVPLISFISAGEVSNPSPEELSALTSFNILANKYAALPYEWGQEKSGKNKNKYEKAKEEYAEARQKVLEIMSQRETPEEKGRSLLRTAEIDYSVEMEQLLTTHPEYEKEIQDFSRSAGAMEYLKTTGGFLNTITGGKNWTNKLLTLGGFGARMAARGAAIISSSTIVTAIAAPLIGGVVGGWRAKIRAKETLTAKKKLSRYGTKDESAEAANTVDIVNLNKRMGDLLKSLEQASTEEEKEKRVDQLKRRMAYIDEKMEAGLVNFGDAKSSLKNQFDLIKNINEALVATSASEASTNEDIDKRLEQFLAYKASKIEDAQKIFVKKQMRRGAILGASFATGGYVVRWLGEYLGWWGDVSGTHTTDASPKEAEEGFLDRADNWMTKAWEKIKSPFTGSPEETSTAQTPKESWANLKKDTPEIKPDETIQELPKASRTLADVMKDAPGVKTTSPSIASGEIKLEAIIGKGEGIEHALKRQIASDEKLAEALGYKEGMDLKKFSEGEAHRMAIRHGYVDQTTGEEIRIGVGEGKVAYQITPSGDGEFKIQEFQMKDGKFTPSDEAHGDESGFEGDKKENYEYRTGKKNLARSKEINAPEEQPLPKGTRSLKDALPKSEEKISSHPEPRRIRDYDVAEHDAQVARARAEVEAKLSRPNTIPIGHDISIGGGEPEAQDYIPRAAGQNIEFRGNEYWPQGERGHDYIPENIRGGHPDGGVNTYYHTGPYSHGGAYYDNSSRAAIIANQYDQPFEGRFAGDKYFSDLSPQANAKLKLYPEFYKNPFNLSGEKLYRAWEIHNVNLVKIFPQDTNELWDNVRGTGAKEMFYTNPANAEEGLSPLINYMRKLNQVTGLVPDKDVPKVGFFRRIFGGAQKAETAEEYIARALQRAAQIGRLREVALPAQS